jgi:hypothetical protein
VQDIDKKNRLLSQAIFFSSMVVRSRPFPDASEPLFSHGGGQSLAHLMIVIDVAFDVGLAGALGPVLVVDILQPFELG